jgi:hypothetical protein
MKTTSFKKFFNEFTHNEIALYLLLGIALVNLLTYLQYNYLGGVIIFLVVGLITSHFTKNMVIVLAGTILLTNVLVSFGILSNLGVREGLDNKKDDDDDDDEACKSTTDCKKGMYCDMRSKKCVAQEMNNNDMNIDVTETSVVDISDPSTLQVKSQSPTPTPPTPPTPSTPPTPPTPPTSGPVSSPPTTKSGFKNFDEDDEDTITISQKSKKYSNAMNDAQNSLKHILGGNGTQNLDTAELLKQQKDLMQAMQGMQPLIDGANGMLNKIGSSPLGKMLGVTNN